MVNNSTEKKKKKKNDLLPQIIENKKIMTYGNGIAGRGLRQAYKGSGVKLFMSFQPSPSW